MPDLNRDEVLALLPWYVNGSLPEPDARRVEHWLHAHADPASDVHAELAWLRATAAQVRQGMQLPSADLGLDKVLQRIHAEAAEPDAARAPTAGPHAAARWSAAGGLLSAARLLWNALVRRRSWALGGLALAQAAVIAVLVGHAPSTTEQEPLSGPRPPALVDGVLLQVAFVPTATEAQIRSAMQQVAGIIVGGPGALGLYTVAVPRATAESAAIALRQKSGVVESVSPLPAR